MGEPAVTTSEGDVPWFWNPAGDPRVSVPPEEDERIGDHQRPR